jgi:uncharacterized protein YcnI
MSRRIVFGGLVVALIGLLAAPAWAHVSVSPSEAPRGSFTTLTFQVPNETEDANTTKVEVQFPQDHPIADASVQAIPGWNVVVTKKALETPITTDEGDSLDEGVNTVTWTATGDGIKPGFFEQFKVSVGLPAEGDTLTFPALQTYDNGDVVRWIGVETTPGEEPEDPAPTLTLTEAGEDDHGATATTVPAASDGGASAAAINDAQDDADTAKKIAVVGIVVGAGGILGAFAALLRKRPIT